MLRELDFVDSDWRALLWAFGSTTALVRHSVPRQLRTTGKRVGPASRQMLTRIAENAGGVLVGVAMAGGVVALSVWGVLNLVSTAVPEWQMGHVRLLEWLTFILIPETVFSVAAVALWRKRRTVAVGILLSAMMLTTHLFVHAARHS